MKIAGNSFAFLTQLGQDAASRGPNAAQDKAAKKAAERAARIAQVREAQDIQISRLRRDDVDIGDKRRETGSSPRRDKPFLREALGPPRQERRAEPGQVLNIVI